MSADLGPLSLDQRHLWRDDQDDSDDLDIEPDDQAGAWPADVETRYVAETSMAIPGQGDAGVHCGEWFPKEFCDECGEPHLGVSRCEQRTCPNCWGAWTRRRAEKIARRLGAARQDEPDGIERRAVHAAISPPEGEIETLHDVKHGYRDAYELAREKGIRGGVAIFHGFRVTPEGTDLYNSAVASGDWDPQKDGKKWSFVRRREERLERDIGNGEDWRTLTYWSPHWHVLGLCVDFEADDPDAQDAWVARNIRPLEAFQLHSEEAYSDMVGAARYLLSHGTFETDTSKDCVRWFGDLATAKFSPEESLSEGTLSVIERMAKEAAQSHEERGEGTPENDECDVCGSRSRSPIWEAGAALMDKSWCNRIEREQLRRLEAAFNWAIGDFEPPPGMRGPLTEEQGQELLEWMVDQL